MTETGGLDELLACPRCGRAPLESSDDKRRCAGCEAAYPEVAGIPWLFAEPDAALAEWRHRLQLALQREAHEIQRLGAALKRKGLLEATRKRLEQHRDACEVHRSKLLDLLRPLDPGSLGASYESHLALRTRLPSDQGLNTYYHNVHRDWAWGDEENAASLAEIDAVLERSALPSPAAWAVLGSGAGRLAYDLHETFDAATTVAVDFNPLLAIIAQRMFRGETLELCEFPLAPVTLEDVARRQTLAAPAAARAGLESVLADVSRPPLAESGFDVVVTPWLLDVLDEDLTLFAKRLNRLLKPGGSWINFGSLAFEHADRARRYSGEEVAEIVGQSGFGEPAGRDGWIPYLASPHSRHARRELVHTFAVQKTTDVRPQERRKALPDWIVTGKLPVPLTRSFKTQAASTRVYAYVMSLIDGKRSIEDIARLLEKQQLMPRSEAKSAIRNFLIRMYEDSQRNPGF